MIWKKKKNNRLKLFVSIGAGFNQIPLIKEAKKIGFHIIAVDKNTSAAGFLISDIRIQESITDYKEIYRKLQELMIDGEICGVMTGSHGEAVKTACFLSDKLNIPMLPFERVDDFINKKRMKSVFKRNKIITPKYILVNIERNIKKIRKNAYPMVIKPLKGHAKVNVKLIMEASELEKFLNKAPKDLYLLEKYIAGDEIIAFGIVHQGKYYLADITDKIKTPPPHFVDLVHISPSKFIHLHDKITEIGQRVSESFEIVNSPLLMEMIVDSDENIHIIEAVPEFGGEFIPNILIPEQTGYNFIGETIKAAVGLNFSPPALKKTKTSVVIKFITGHKGILASFNPEKPNNIEETIFSRIFIEIGSRMKAPRTNHDRIGVVITSAKSREDAINAAEQASAAFNIKVN